MTTYQTGAQIVVALHRETSFNVQATATGAQQLRIIAGANGAVLTRAQIQSQEKLATGLTTMGRLGYKSVPGSFDTEFTAGGATDLILEALQRSAWATATSVAFASVTTVALGTNYLSCGASSSFITAGVKVGDIFTLSGTTVSGDNGTNCIAIAVTTQTISTTSSAFTTLAATATGTLTILKKVTSPTTYPTRYSHTIEQYDVNIDESEVFTGNRVTGVKLVMAPGQMVKMTTTFAGADRVVESTGTAPYFSSPTLTTSVPLVADDGAILYNGTQVASFTGMTLDFQIAAKGEPVIGSLVTPDIFDNNLTAQNCSITALRSDLSNLTLFDAETEFAISVLLQEPTGSPAKCMGLFLPRVKISALSAPVGGGDGAKIETLTLMLGPKTADSTHDASFVNFFSSEA